MFQTALQVIAKGAPELNIPPIDPLELKNISATLMNLFDVTLLNGIVRGVKDCVFERVT